MKTGHGCRKMFILACALALAPAAATASEKLPILFFGDVNIDGSYPNNARGRNDFRIGQLDLFLHQHLTDKVRFLTEIVFETGANGETVADLERLWVGYDVDELLKLQLGKEHTPIGYWNHTYHHGAILHQGIARPGFLDFEDDGGLLPVHDIGLMASGSKVITDAFEPKYKVMVGNGGSNLPNGPNASADSDKHKPVTVRVGATLYEVFEFGVGGRTERIDFSTMTDRSSPNLGIKQKILSLDAKFDWAGLGILAEYHEVFNQRDGVPGTSRNPMYFGQAAYTLSGRLSNFTPYARYESAITAPLDPFYALIPESAGKRQVVLGGLKWQPSAQFAVKGEVQGVKSPGLATRTRSIVQVAFVY